MTSNFKSTGRKHRCLFVSSRGKNKLSKQIFKGQIYLKNIDLIFKVNFKSKRQIKNLCNGLLIPLKYKIFI